jgi:hypothetical protein
MQVPDLFMASAYCTIYLAKGLQLTDIVLQARGGAIDFDVQHYKSKLGVPSLTCGSSVEEILTMRWCMPSISITDISSSSTNQPRTSFGPTRFSVVPKFAQVGLANGVDTPLANRAHWSSIFGFVTIVWCIAYMIRVLGLVVHVG